MPGFEYANTEVDGGFKVRTYATDGAARRIALGDVVILTGTADAAGVPQVTTTSADTAGLVAGVVVGFVPDFSTENFVVGVPASTANKVIVCDDPKALFEVESDATLGVADVGLNIGTLYSATTASGAIYTSNLKIKSASKATTATLPFTIVKLLRGATSGVLGDRALVRFNNTSNSAGATGT